MQNQPLEHMTVWGLVSEASIVVQAVMLCLVLASLLSWYLIVQRDGVLRRSERLAKAFLKRFRTEDAGQLYRESAQHELPTDAALQRIFVAGYQTFSQVQPQAEGSPDVVIDGVERSLYVASPRRKSAWKKGCRS